MLQVADTPFGKPVAVPIPVAPVVAMVMDGVSAVLIQIDGLAEGAATILTGFTVIVPDALTIPQPPISGIV